MPKNTNKVLVQLFFYYNFTNDKSTTFIIS